MRKLLLAVSAILFIISAAIFLFADFKTTHELVATLFKKAICIAIFDDVVDFSMWLVRYGEYDTPKT